MFVEGIPEDYGPIVENTTRKQSNNLMEQSH